MATSGLKASFIYLLVIAAGVWRAGAGAAVAGLLFVNKLGAGTLASFTSAAKLLMPVVIDKFGWVGAPGHVLRPGRMVSCASTGGGGGRISQVLGLCQ